MEIWACETVTGRKLASLPFTAHQWETVLNGAGTVDVTIPLRKLPEKRRAEVKTYVEPVRCSLAAVADNGQVLEAGPIWRSRFDDKSGTLKVGASGLWSIFDKRKVLPAVWDVSKPVQEASVGLSGKYGHIVATLVWESTQRTGGGLPISYLPIPEMPDQVTRWYEGYELKWLGDALRELNQVSGGPDIAFQPNVSSDGLSIFWALRIGGPMLTQVGDDWLWDRGAPRNGLQAIDVDNDATGMGQRAFAAGNGHDTGVVIGVAENTAAFDAGFPLTEVQTSVATLQDPTAVTNHAISALKPALRPWNTLVITARDQQPDVGMYRPGDWATVVIPSTHEYLPPGPVRARILSIAGDQTRTVTVRLAPVMEAR